MHNNKRTVMRGSDTGLGWYSLWATYQWFRQQTSHRLRYILIIFPVFIIEHGLEEECCYPKEYRIAEGQGIQGFEARCSRLWPTVQQRRVVTDKQTNQHNKYPDNTCKLYQKEKPILLHLKRRTLSVPACVCVCVFVCVCVCVRARATEEVALIFITECVVVF